MHMFILVYTVCPLLHFYFSCYGNVTGHKLELTMTDNVSGFTWEKANIEVIRVRSADCSVCIKQH